MATSNIERLGKGLQILKSGLASYELHELGRELLRQRFEAETRRELKQSAAVTQTRTVKRLKHWRQIATPYPDVASSHYRSCQQLFLY